MPLLADIQAAHQRIAAHVHRTPVLTCRALDRLTGLSLFFKCENFQKAGAFKSRGACNAVFSLTDEEAACGVVTHSSGNHAGALARAAQVRGIRAHIVMPETAPNVKVAAVHEYGGLVTFCAPTLEARETTAARIQAETSAVMIHPYDDERIIAGQGTAAVEFLEDVPDLDIIMTPVGGGGLLAGTAVAAKSLCDAITVWAGEPYLVSDAWQSLQAGKRMPATQRPSIADGLLTSLGELTFPLIQQHVDEILLASEQGIRSAKTLMMERMKIVVEPSSAVPLAALLENPEIVQSRAGSRVGVIVSGGNVSL